MQKIAILGASYLQLPLVLKAKFLGIETHCFAWEDGAVCKKYADFFYPISVTEKEDILRICSKVEIDGITTIATDLPVPTISYVANKLGLIGNSIETSIISTNKELMKKTFIQNKCSVPIQYETDEEIKFPCIVKPVDRSGSRGVSIVKMRSELPNAICEANKVSITNKSIIEEYIEGREISVEAISWKGTHKIITITDKETTEAPYFVEIAHHQPAILTKDIKSKVIKECLKCLNALKIENGASHSEFKITKDGRVVVIEVGARMGGDFIGASLVELSTGYDYLKAVLNIASNKFEWEDIQLKNEYSGIYFLSKETEKLLPYFDKEYDFIVKKEKVKGTLKYLENSNDRSGYIIYHHSKNKIIL